MDTRNTQVKSHFRLETPKTQVISQFRYETHLRHHFSTFKWDLKNFSRRKGIFCSKEFKPVGECRTKWRMLINCVKKGMNEVHVTIQRIDKEKDILFAHFHIRLQNSKREVFYEKGVTRHPCKRGTQWGIKVQRPSRAQGLLIPNTNGKFFLLKEDDLFIVKTTIQVEKCCPFTQVLPLKCSQSKLERFDFHSETSSNTKRKQTSLPFMDIDAYEHGCLINWKINNFSHYRKRICSEVFPPVKGCLTRWRLQIDFKYGLIDQMHIKILRMSNSTENLSPSFHISVQNTKGKVFQQETMKSWLGKEWGVILCRPSCSQLLLIPDSKTEAFKLENDDVVIIKVIILLANGCSVNDQVLVKRVKS